MQLGRRCGHRRLRRRRAIAGSATYRLPHALRGLTHSQSSQTHLSFHHPFDFAGLRTFCDIREIINCYQDKIDWDQVLQRAKKWGAGNSVYLTILLAKELLDAQAPEDFIAALKPDGSDSEAREWAIEQIFGKTSYVRPGKLLTASSSLIVSQVGNLSQASLQSIVQAVVDLLRSGLQM